MNDIDFVIAYMLERANQLDSVGRFAEATRIDRHAQRISTAGYGGGMAEYVGKLLELARSKGIDYMKTRMEESRIVTLNDGTPIMKRDDAPQFVEAVVARAKALKLPETKGLQPKSPGKVDPRWSGEFNKRVDDIASGKSSWLNQAKPFSDAMEEKKRKKLKWEPPKAESEKQSLGNSAPRPAYVLKSTSTPRQELPASSNSNPDNSVQSWVPEALRPLNKRSPASNNSKPNNSVLLPASSNSNPDNSVQSWVPEALRPLNNKQR